MSRPAPTPPVRVGTSSWSSPDWKGNFYPADARPADFLHYYSRRFDTVECDATFYGIPRRSTVDGWVERTPPGFLFAAKLPREITHDRGMVDCADVLRDFLEVMTRLGDRLGPLVAQFAYVPKRRDAREYATGDEFRARLRRFLELWPREVELAVEVRNRGWIAPPLLDLLRRHRVALVFPVYYTMPGPDALFAGPDPVTTDLVYVRFLGDHRRMDALVEKLRSEGRRRREWESPAVDKSDEMRRWVPHLRRRASEGFRVLAYFNNHYAGHGPTSAERFLELWSEAPAA